MIRNESEQSRSIMWVFFFISGWINPWSTNLGLRMWSHRKKLNKNNISFFSVTFSVTFLSDIFCDICRDNCDMLFNDTESNQQASTKMDVDNETDVVEKTDFNVENNSSNDVFELQTSTMMKLLSSLKEIFFEQWSIRNERRGNKNAIYVCFFYRKLKILKN